MSQPTDVPQFINDLKGGVAEKQLGLFLSIVAGACIKHNAAGKVTLTLDVKRLSDSDQVEIAHKLEFKAPTETGEQTEKASGRTPMFVHTGGALSIMPQRVKVEDMA